MALQDEEDLESPQQVPSVLFPRAERLFDLVNRFQSLACCFSPKCCPLFMTSISKDHFSYLRDKGHWPL